MSTSHYWPCTEEIHKRIHNMLTSTTGTLQPPQKIGSKRKRRLYKGEKGLVRNCNVGSSVDLINLWRKTLLKGGGGGRKWTRIPRWTTWTQEHPTDTHTNTHKKRWRVRAWGGRKYKKKRVKTNQRCWEHERKREGGNLLGRAYLRRLWCRSHALGSRLAVVRSLLAVILSPGRAVVWLAPGLGRWRRSCSCLGSSLTCRR